MPCLPSWWRIPRGWGQWPPGSPRQRTNDLITGQECDMKNTAIVFSLIYGDFRARTMARLNIKTAFPGYRYSFYKDESVVRPSYIYNGPDSKVHGDNMGNIWGRQGPGRPHVGPMNLAIWGNPYSIKTISLYWDVPQLFRARKRGSVECNYLFMP